MALFGRHWRPVWGGDPEPQPFRPEMLITQMPVGSAPGHPFAQEADPSCLPARSPRLAERNSPGDPRCRACRDDERGYCPAHSHFHYCTEAMWGIG
jgi:hypothetical protein